MSERIIDVANAIRADRYKDAVAIFAAGSIIRGEGTPFSDLDLVQGTTPQPRRLELDTELVVRASTAPPVQW